MSGDRFIARWFSTDLAAVAACPFLLGVSLLVPGRPGEVLHLVVGMAFVFFCPGYVFVAALFPEEHAVEAVERTLLTVVVSLLAVTAVGVLLHFSAWPISSRNVLLGLSAETILGVAIAAYRRPENYELGWVERNNLRNYIRNRTLLNVVVVTAVIAAAGTVTYATYTDRTDGFTEAYLLTPNESGKLVAAGGSDLENGSESSTQVVFNLENHEGNPIQYTVIVRRQSVVATENDTNRSDSYRLDDGRTVSRFSRQVGAGERWRTTDVLRPPDGRVRVSYLVYRGDPPNDPSLTNAYREVHLWLSNSRSENGTE